MKVAVVVLILFLQLLFCLDFFVSGEHAVVRLGVDFCNECVERDPDECIRMDGIVVLHAMAMRGSKAMIVAVEAGCIGCLMKLAVATCTRYVGRRKQWGSSVVYKLKTCSTVRSFMCGDFWERSHQRPCFLHALFLMVTAMVMVTVLNGCPVSNCSMLLC